MGRWVRVIMDLPGMAERVSADSQNATDPLTRHLHSEPYERRPETAYFLALFPAGPVPASWWRAS